MNIFSKETIFFTVQDYPMSYLEFFGTLTGASAVYLATKANIWSWPLGLINVFLFFFLFYQVQLYPDMFLQVFFFITNLMGWWRWKNPKPGEEYKKNELKISLMPRKAWAIFLPIAIIGTVLLGLLAQNLSTLLPFLFSKPSAFPFMDSFVTVMSVLATYLLVQKKLECWIIWILVDAVACYLYFSKHILLVGIEYLIFCLMAVFGFWSWMRKYTKSRTHT